MEHAIAVDVTGMPRFDWNTRWPRVRGRVGGHDDQPAFNWRSPNGGSPEYTLYFCDTTQQWRIDNANTKGLYAHGDPVFAHSANADINSAWTVQAHWRDCPEMHVEVIAAGGGVRVSGARADENGTYRRVSEDHAGRGRYTKSDPERHIYWDDVGGTWVVAPTLAVGDGAYALSATALLIGAWMTAPADVETPDVRFALVCGE